MSGSGSQENCKEEVEEGRQICCKWPERERRGQIFFFFFFNMMYWYFILFL